MANIKKQVKRRLPLVGIFLVLLVGIALFMYPIVSNWLANYTAKTEISSYDEAIQKLGDDAIKEIEKQAQEYNKAIAQHDQKKVNITRYNDLLAVTDSIGYIEIPKINVYLPIYHGMSDDVLQKGIGHMEGTSLPIGGTSTHSVLAGHTGLPAANLFTDLDQLVINDYFYIHVLDKVLAYKVDQIKIVLPYETEDTQTVEGEDYVTLVTCTPYGINDHRLLVRGTRVPYETQTRQNTNPWPVVHKTEDTKVPARTIIWYTGLAVVCGVVVIILIILFVPVFKRKKRRKTEQNKE